MNREGYISKFYQSIDAPMMLFLIEADEALVGIVAFFGLMIGTMLSGAVIGGLSFFYLAFSILFTYYYGKYKRSKPDGFTLQMLYKLGYFHPTVLPRKSKAIKKTHDFKVVPTFYTKSFKGQ